MAVAYKLSFVFQNISGVAGGAAQQRTGSWSESVYSGDPLNSVINSFRRFASARAGLLPFSAAIVGFRSQQVNPVGGVQTQAVSYPGTLFATDVPQMALLFSVRANGVSNVRRMKIACIPDSVIVLGEYAPPAGSQFPPALAAYFRELQGWQMAGRDLTSVAKQLKTISSAGAYTTGEDFVAPVNSQVKVLSAINANGDKVSGRFEVGDGAALRAGTLRKWPFGDCTNGKIVNYVPIFPIMTTTPAPTVLAAQRKIGRPSLGYRGRRSKRRG